MTKIEEITAEEFYERRELLYNKAMELERLIDEKTSYSELEFVVSQLMALIVGANLADILANKELIYYYLYKGD